MVGRREFSRTVKSEAFARCGGKCEGCGAHLYTGKYQYDHITADSIGGEPTLANCQVLCSACHGVKTAKIDTPRAAKTKRQHDAHIGAKRSSGSMPFGRSSSLKRKMNGDVVPRDTRRSS